MYLYAMSQDSRSFPFVKKKQKTIFKRDMYTTILRVNLNI